MNKTVTVVDQVVISEIQKILAIQKECALTAWTSNDYQQEILNGSSLLLVARENKKTVGFLASRFLKKELSEGIEKHTAAKYSEAEILNFGVSQNFRKTGVGSHLIREFMEKAGRLSVETIWLEVRASNFTAINFYSHKGFTETHRRKNYFSAPLEDAIVMKFVVRSERVGEISKT